MEAPVAAEYKFLYDATNAYGVSETVLRYIDSAYIPPDPANVDRQAYDEYTAAGGLTDPPIIPPTPTPAPDPNARLDDGVSAAVSTYQQHTPPAERGGQGGLTAEERLLRLEETMKAMCNGQMGTAAAAFA